MKITAGDVTPESGLVQEDILITPIRVEMWQGTHQIMETNPLKRWATFLSYKKVLTQHIFFLRVVPPGDEPVKSLTRKGLMLWVELPIRKQESVLLQTTKINLKRGVRQGCPLSGLLFVLGIELLNLTIQMNSNIKEIKVGDEEIKKYLIWR